MKNKISLSETSKKVNFLRTKLLIWANDNFRNLPWRNTEDPYKILVAEIMLHQTSAKKVQPVYAEFISKFPEIISLRKAQVRTIEKIIFSLGLKYRAKVLKKIAQIIAKEFNGKIPLNKESLLSLPSVGEYTASAILCFAKNVPYPIIDANINRIYGRFFGFKIEMPYRNPGSDINKIALKVLPKNSAKKFNYALLDFAAEICTHYKPKCLSCALNRMCEFYINRQF